MLAIILDVVDSRQHAHQDRLLRGIDVTVRRVLVDDGSAQSAGATIGDELQALYDDALLGSAVFDVARLRLVLQLEPPGDVPVRLRAGFGRGDVTGDQSDATAPAQSGTAWWAARDALDRASDGRRAWPEVSWWYEGASAPQVRAVLTALDTLWQRFDATDLRCALGLLDGTTAAGLADELGVGRSTLSARLHTHGVYGWVRTLETLVAVTS